MPQHERLEAARIRLLHRNAPLGIAATLINASLLIALNRDVVPRWSLAAWAALIALVTTARCVDFMLTSRWHKYTSASALKARFMTGLVASGMVWGSAAWLIFPDESIPHQSMVALVVAGMVAGAAAAFSVSLRAFLSYSLPAIVPLTIRELALGGELHVSTGILLCFFFTLLFFACLKTSHTTFEALRLSFENEHLVGVMTQARDRAESANAELGQEISQRRRAETQLREHKLGLERTVENRTAELQEANIRLRTEIAERKRMEQELMRRQKLESLGVLAGGIAHDFNNLLTGIMSSLELVSMTSDLRQPVSERIDDARRALLQARRLTNQLLTFSTGGAPVRSVVSMEELIRECISFVVADSDVRTTLQFADDLWAADVDAGQMAQVVQNLVLNASDAMPAGGLVTVNCRNAVSGSAEPGPLETGRYVRIEVTDSGPGIPLEEQSRIFDPYYTTKSAGTGLGLATCHSIVTKHGGTIAVHSQPGHGASFVCYLPAAPEGASPPVTEERQTHPSVRGTRVLLMDDDLNIRRTIRLLLTELGFDAMTVTDGKEAVQCYKDASAHGKPFHVVILDLTVPQGMGGQEAARQILAFDQNAKLIVSSGYSVNSVMANYKAFGFSAALAKPYVAKELERVVAQLAAAARARVTHADMDSAKS